MWPRCSTPGAFRTGPSMTPATIPPSRAPITAPDIQATNSKPKCGRSREKPSLPSAPVAHSLAVTLESRLCAAQQNTLVSWSDNQQLSGSYGAHGESRLPNVSGGRWLLHLRAEGLGRHAAYGRRSTRHEPADADLAALSLVLVQRAQRHFDRSPADS